MCVFMACLKDDKSVMFLISAGEAFHSRGQQPRKLSLQIVSWCEGCRIWSSLLDEADDVLAMTRPESLTNRSSSGILTATFARMVSLLTKLKAFENFNLTKTWLLGKFDRRRRDACTTASALHETTTLTCVSCSSSLLLITNEFVDFAVKRLNV